MPASPERRVASSESVNLECGGIGRRQFLQTLGGSMAALSLTARTIVADEPISALETQSVNTHLRSIPTTIPGIAHHQLTLTEGASHGLIVIEQIHWAREMDMEGARAIERCQWQIYTALSFLLKGKWIDEVYAEGKMAAGEARADPAYTGYETAEAQGLNGIAEIAEIGAEHVLQREGLLRLKGAERKATYDEAGKVQDSANFNEWYWAVCEARENALLDIIATEDDPIACTVLGCRHKLRNNIWSWNRTKDQKFSLLTLVPELIDSNRKAGRPDSALPPPVPASPAVAGGGD